MDKKTNKFVKYAKLICFNKGGIMKNLMLTYSQIHLH
jgi:hypothetical protein